MSRRSRASAGRSARSRGATFEAQLEAYHETLGLRGKAHVYRVPHPVKRLSVGALRPKVARLLPTAIRGSAWFVAVNQAQGPCDFGGAVAGLPVHFDAKATNQQRWSLSQLKPQQALHLTRCEAAGGWVLLRFEHPGRLLTYLLPWERLRPLWEAQQAGTAARGSASLTVETAAEHGFPVSGLCNWLPAFQAWAVL